MKVAILGYGKMGKEIEKTAIERNHEIVLVVDENSTGELTIPNLKKADVAIDFSIPSSAFNNILRCFEADVPIVSGTTGWLDKYEMVKEICVRENKSFFYASNFSLGVNVLFALNKYLAKIMNRFPDYEISIEEIHHIHKIDAPSGTAIYLANDIIGNIDRKKNWELKTPGHEKNPEVLDIEALRENEVPGTHHVTYDSPVDTLEIWHAAKSRRGLALGALLAAEFLKDKKGVYSMDDLLNLG
jgi:4-hydroxy-tetrahydrodipicolinate reductase